MSSISATTSTSILSASTINFDRSDPYGSISEAMLSSSSTSALASSEAVGASSNSFLFLEEALSFSSSPPALYVSSEAFYNITSSASPDTSLVSSMGTSSFASSSSSSSGLTTSCPVSSSISQDHLSTAAASKSTDDTILYALQNTSAVSSSSSVNPTRAIHSTQLLRRHKRASSFPSSSQEALVENRAKELIEKEAWVSVCPEEELWRKAVLRKDIKIVQLNKENFQLKHAIDVTSSKYKELWSAYLETDNIKFEQIAACQANYILRIEKLNLALKAAENQYAQTKEKLTSEKNKIEKLLEEIKKIFGGHLEVSTSKSSLSSSLQGSSSTSSLSTSSVSSDSAPRTQALYEQQPRIESAPQKPPSSWWCVIC